MSKPPRDMVEPPKNRTGRGRKTLAETDETNLDLCLFHLRGCWMLFRVEERFLDGLPKHSHDFVSERQARIVFAGLDGVDALARHANSFGQFGLGPLFLGTPDSKLRFHSNRLEKKNSPMLQRATMTAGRT